MLIDARGELVPGSLQLASLDLSSSLAQTRPDLIHTDWTDILHCAYMNINVGLHFSKHYIHAGVYSVK